MKEYHPDELNERFELSVDLISFLVIVLQSRSFIILLFTFFVPGIVDVVRMFHKGILSDLFMIAGLPSIIMGYFLFIKGVNASFYLKSFAHYGRLFLVLAASGYIYMDVFFKPSTIGIDGYLVALVDLFCILYILFSRRFRGLIGSRLGN